MLVAVLLAVGALLKYMHNFSNVRNFRFCSSKSFFNHLSFLLHLDGICSRVKK